MRYQLGINREKKETFITRTEQQNRREGETILGGVGRR